MSPTIDWNRWDDAWLIFYRVRDFVSKKFPKLVGVHLNMTCDEIYEYRKSHRGVEGQRAMMHVAHKPKTVCAWFPAAAGLSVNHLVGLYLHEFGHLGSNGDDAAADRWVKENFGIRIAYRTARSLEWVGAADVRKVMAVVRRRRR